ncbi:unnamed protein product, partial [Brachionus calyciflorus]
MVNRTTAIKKINRLFLTENVTTMKKWSNRFRVASSNRKSWYLGKLKKQIRHILGIISGNDIIAMLKDVLHKKERKQLSFECYIDSLKNLIDFYKSIKLKERHKFIRPIKNSGVCYSELRDMGFPVSRHLWESCEKSNERNKGGGKSISEDLKDSLNVYLQERSSIASNRLFINRDPSHPEFRTNQSARYLEDQYSELFKSFQFSSQLSFSSFYKYASLSGQFKKPFRLTDICDYCEWSKILKKEIEKKTKELNYNFGEQFDFRKTLFAFEKKKTILQNILSEELSINIEKRNELEKIDSLISDLNDYGTKIFHKNVAMVQRETYNKHRSNVDFLREKILIEVDFKQKITLGLSPRQVNTEYYNQISRSFGIYFVDNDGIIKMINFTIISSDISEDSKA